MSIAVDQTLINFPRRFSKSASRRAHDSNRDDLGTNSELSESPLHPQVKSAPSQSRFSGALEAENIAVTTHSAIDPPEVEAPSPSRLRSAALLFLASFLSLYFELVIVRYLSTEIRVFAYLKNLPLIASFFGLGLGMISTRGRDKRRFFPAITAALFLAIILAPHIGLTHLPVPGSEYEMLGTLRRRPMVYGEYFSSR
jgi:hypothetical protein